MGNQLSTWNLSIQSAVDGENFNYNPDYNQVPFFLSSYLDINLFSEHTSLFTATKWRCVNPSLDGKIALSPQAPYIFADYTWFYIGIGATAGKADYLDFQNLFVDSSGLGQNYNQLFAQVLLCS